MGAGPRPIDLLKIPEILYYYRLIQFILGKNFKVHINPNFFFAYLIILHLKVTPVKKFFDFVEIRAFYGNLKFATTTLIPRSFGELGRERRKTPVTSFKKGLAAKIRFPEEITVRRRYLPRIVGEKMLKDSL